MGSGKLRASQRTVGGYLCRKRHSSIFPLSLLLVRVAFSSQVSVGTFPEAPQIKGSGMRSLGPTVARATVSQTKSSPPAFWKAFRLLKSLAASPA